jgi:hypothetical protein
METFRCSAGVLLVSLSLACLSRDGNAGVPAAAEVAAIERQGIDHLVPKRDHVGPAPTRLEWTAAEGADTYNITVSTEIDTLVFAHVGAGATSIDWPREITLEPGTYFWRVVGITGGRGVADSGRAAFVVMN